MNLGKYVLISSIVVGDVISLNGVPSLVLSSKPPRSRDKSWSVIAFRQGRAAAWYVSGNKAEVWKCFT